MLRRHYPALFLLALLPIAACHKASCIEGTVLDAKTGQPVPNVRLELYYQTTEKKYDSPKITHYETVVSDAAGTFSFSTEDKHSGDIYVYAASKDGYSNVFKTDRKSGKGCEEVVLNLIPLDGLLQLRIDNETATHDSIYVSIFNKCTYDTDYRIGGYALTNPYPLGLQPGGMHMETFAACGGDSSAIRWKFSATDPWFDIDTVLVKTGDTTFFNIVY